MNKRRPSDYGPFLKDVVGMVNAYLASGDKIEAEQIRLYWSIGAAICARPERSAAVVLSEELARTFPEEKGFSPRNVRRMREFYRTYSDCPVMAALAFEIGWTSNVLIMEHCDTPGERETYLKAVRCTGWSKAELLRSFDEPTLPEGSASEPAGTETPREQLVSAKGAVPGKEPPRTPSAPCEAAVPACGPTEATPHRILTAGAIGYADSPGFELTHCLCQRQFEGRERLPQVGNPMLPVPDALQAIGKGIVSGLDALPDAVGKGHQGGVSRLHRDAGQACQQDVDTGGRRSTSMELTPERVSSPRHKESKSKSQEQLSSGSTSSPRGTVPQTGAQRLTTWRDSRRPYSQDSIFSRRKHCAGAKRLNRSTKTRLPVRMLASASCSASSNVGQTAPYRSPPSPAP